MEEQVFLSYSRRDSKFVDQLVVDLEAAGISVWIDRGDIHAGDATWRQQIVTGIKSSPVFIIVLSPDSFKSDDVGSELTVAHSHRKTIIPILLKSAQIPDSMEYQLAGRQHIDFSTGDYADNLGQLLNSLARLGYGDGAEALPAVSGMTGSPLRKIPVWGWIAGAVVLLLALGFGGYNIFGVGAAVPTITPSLVVEVALEEPTETELPPTATNTPTETPKPTATPTMEPEDTPVPDTPTPTEIPSPTPLPLLWKDGKGVEMVLVPAGPFIMGSNSFEDNSFPAHSQETVEYYIDKYEATNASYAKCVQEGACQPPRSSGSKTRAKYYENSDYAFYPVIWVNWDDAVAYCEWRGGRLPTEVEWEKAARGDDARTYPWGDDVGTECVEANYWEYNGCGDTRAIGSTLGESPYGAFEMAGNVWEWVQDDFIAYPGGKPSSIASSAIGNKVIRGGSWNELAKTIKTTYRFSFDPKRDANDIGFRCVIDTPLP